MYKVISQTGELIITHPDSNVVGKVTFIPIDESLATYRRFLSRWQDGEEVLSSIGSSLTFGDTLS